MKNIYAMLLLSLPCLSVGAVADSALPVPGSGHRNYPVTASGAPVWCPVSSTSYYHADEGWAKLESAAYQYDSHGNCTEIIRTDQDGVLQKQILTYNEFGMCVAAEMVTGKDGIDWENSFKLSYAYDPVVHNFVIEYLAYNWGAGEWNRGGCYSLEVSRNNDGNIVEILWSTTDGPDAFKPMSKSEWSYGSDGKASEYRYYAAASDSEIELCDAYKDIVWEDTDGQMTLLYGDLSMMTEGPNRLKSAVPCRSGQSDGLIQADYFEGNGGYLVTEKNSDGIVVRTVRKEIDADKTETMTREYYDKSGKLVDGSIEIKKYDGHNNLVEQTTKELSNGEWKILSSTKFANVYDTNGNVSEQTMNVYVADGGEYEPRFRTVYGEYINVAGLGSVASDERTVWQVSGDVVRAEADGLTGLTVYNVQGVAVGHADSEISSATVSLSSQAPGLYIIRADGAGSCLRIVKR